MKEDINEVIGELLYETMDPDEDPMDVNSLADDLKMEYPIEFQCFVASMVKKYNLSKCGAHFVHVQGLLGILEQFEEEGKVQKIHQDGKILWKKVI